MWAGSELPRPPWLVRHFRVPPPLREVLSWGETLLFLEEQDGGGWPKILGPFSSSWGGALGFPTVDRWACPTDLCIFFQCQS